MALFTPVLQQQGGSGAEVGAASTPSGNTQIAATAVNAAAGLITFFGNKNKVDDKAAAEKAQTESIARYTNSLTNLANLKRLGNASTAQLNSKADQLQINLVKENPSLALQAIKIRKDIGGMSTGVGKLLTEGTPEERQYNIDLASATTNNFVPQGASAEVAQEGVNNYRLVQGSNLRLANIAKQQGVDKETKRVEAQGVLLDFFKGTSGNIKIKANEIADQVARGVLDAGGAERELNILIESADETATRISVGAGTDFVNAQMGPSRRIIENTLAHIKGDFALDVLKNKNANTKSIYESEIMKDEELAPVLVLSALTGHSNQKLWLKTDAGVARVLGQFTATEDTPNPFTKNTKEQGANEGAYETVMQNISEFNSGSRELTPKAAQDMDVAINKILEGVEEFKGSIRSPKDLKTIVTLLANPQYGKYIEQSGGVSKAQLALVNETIKVEYLDKIKGQLKRDLEKARVQDAIRTRGPTPTASLMDSVDITPNNGTINFRVKEDGSLNQSQKSYVISKVKDLNRSVSPILNEMVRLGAHMEGNTNYSEFLNSNFESVFGLRETEVAVDDSITTQPEAQGVDLSGFEDGEYEDDAGNRVTIKDGKVVE